jgi:hypothetical protein
MFCSPNWIRSTCAAPDKQPPPPPPPPLGRHGASFAASDISEGAGHEVAHQA